DAGIAHLQQVAIQRQGGTQVEPIKWRNGPRWPNPNDTRLLVHLTPAYLPETPRPEFAPQNGNTPQLTRVSAEGVSFRSCRRADASLQLAAATAPAGTSLAVWDSVALARARARRRVRS